MRRKTIAASLAIGCVLALSAGCSTDGTRPPSSNATGIPGLAEVPVKSSDPGAVPLWPTPADCVTYNPSSVTVKYDAGSYTVADGATEVMRVRGTASGDAGKQALALAQRYGRHCFIGRANTRAENPEAYVFDYWRDPSAKNPVIPAESCSKYNKNTLDLENLSGGKGWRIKDKDHVLALFDNQADALDGKLVLSKYGMLCMIDQVTYSK